MAFECCWLGDIKKKITKKKAACPPTVIDQRGGIAPVAGGLIERGAKGQFITGGVGDDVSGGIGSCVSSDRSRQDGNCLARTTFQQLVSQGPFS